MLFVLFDITYKKKLLKIMNKIQKKALYENIMRSISKTIKKRLNEDNDYEDYSYNINVCLDEIGDESLKAEVINNIKRMLGDILKIVGLLNDGDISYDEVNSVFTKIDKAISER